MRLLLLADVHLDAPFTWAGPDQGRVRRQALRDTLRSAFDLVAEHHVDAVAIAGDLYEHERSTPDTGRFLAELFASVAPVPVFLAPGNHDWYGPASLYHLTDFPPNVTVFRTAALTPVRLADGFTLWGAAHTGPANTPGFLRDFTVTGSGIHVAVFHGSEQSSLAAEGSAKVPHAPFHAAQIAVSGLHHALVGHLHTPADAARHTYPGNPEPLTFGETGDRAAVIVEVDENGNVTRTRHHIAHTTVTDETLDVTGLEHSDAVNRAVADTLAARHGVVRLTVHGDLDPKLNLDPDLWARSATNLDALVVRLGELHPAFDFDGLATEATVRGQFVRDVLAANLDETRTRRVLGTGLRALAGRDDLEVR